VDPARVVGVQVREDQPADVAGRDAQALELRADLLAGGHALAHGEAEERLPAGEVAALRGAGGLSGVDDDDAFGVLDREGVDRQRVGPGAVAQGVQQPSPAVPDAIAPAGGDGDGSGLDRVDLHGSQDT
jgi:hypothetical protein